MHTLNRRFSAPSPRLRRVAAFAFWTTLLGLSAPESAEASGFAGRLSLGPSYIQNDTSENRSDSSGPGVSVQLDAGLQLRAPLVAHATLIYDYSKWLSFPAGLSSNDGSMLGFGLGATARIVGLSFGAVAGGQFTFFPSQDDPSSGPLGASLGPFISVSGGYVWPLEAEASAGNVGLHGVLRYRQSKDETVSIVYDPHGVQLCLMLSIGLDGEPLFGG